MNLVQRFDNIRSINGCYKKYVIISTQDNMGLFVSMDDHSIFQEINLKNYRLQITENRIYGYDQNLYIYKDINNCFELYWETSLESYLYVVNEEKVIEGSETDSIFHLNVYDKESRNQIWNKDYNGNRLSSFTRGENIFLSDLMYKTIIFLDQLTGDLIHKLEFSIAPIHQSIYLHQNTLSIPFNDETMIGIDIQTGKKLWDIKNSHFFYTQDTETGLLYSLGNNYYKVVDPVKGEMIVDKVLDDYVDIDGKRSRISMAPSGAMSKDYLYFTSSLLGIRFGAINKHTHEIEFVQDLGTEEGVRVFDFKYHNGRLYILDSNYVLHILE